MAGRPGRKHPETYEFLHATFGEYLVARFTWQLLAEAVARDAVTLAARPMTGHDLITDLLSEVPLTARAPVRCGLLRRDGRRLTGDGRARYTDVLMQSAPGSAAGLGRLGVPAGAGP